MIWTITLAALLLLPSYEFFENKVTIPVTRQLGHLGEQIVLHCKTSSPYVEWKFNGRKIENSDDVYSNSSHHLTLADAKKHQSGNYTCHHPHTKETLSLTELQLGRLMGSEPPQKCIQHETNPNSCLISNFRMFEEFPYLLNVTAVNQLGSATQLHYFFVENIIRPDPPENVSISSICRDSKKLYVQWRPPHTWPYPEIFPLKYKVRYRKEGSKSYITVGPYEKTYLILTGIRPGSTVNVLVAAKDISDLGHNSDWSEVVTGRPWKPNDFRCLPGHLK
ncbi:interleukin-27 subunit beta isoform X2 [Hyla sarda]|uniref:interleukin-27 subunit beta isoform X2 n=1 Tax=Hyla sarda TaxID=327740 RepID=UPI0024C28D41|nr:interleukin-27 subunit beta isoform X2 [Hyla sarda]